MMIANYGELVALLRQYNPWWRGLSIPDLPQWRRAAFRELRDWMVEPPAPRALVVSGARQIGKTTLLLQTIEDLIKRGVQPSKILYATFDHPLLKLAGLEGLLRLWGEMEPAGQGVEYLFLDEIQYTKDWQTWLKHQVDFAKHRRIAVTGSATPLLEEGQESGVGRWHTVRLATLSFYEYLQIKAIAIPQAPQVSTLTQLFDWPQRRMVEVAEDSRALTAHFNQYLLRGGFPQTALVQSVVQAQKLLREDIVDKVLKRDMTALFGVRRVLELEQTFVYLCLHEGGILDIPELCKNLAVKKPTVNNYLAHLEAAHLIYRLPPFGYGKEVLRGRYKVYLADPAIAPSVLLKGETLLEDSTALGAAAEAAFFKHVFTRYYRQSIVFTYWRSKAGEVDIIAMVEGRLVPFEIKYSSHGAGAGDLKALARFCAERKIDRGYVITKEAADLGILTLEGGARVLKIPASLACYWLGRSELGP